MKTLFSLFAANDFSLIAAILVMPLLGAFVNGVFGKRLGKPAVRMMALAAIGTSFAFSIVSFIALNSLHDAAKSAANGEHGAVKLAWTAWEWMRVSGAGGSRIALDLRFSIDPLSGVMMLVVTGVGFLIHVYATEYMIGDKAYWRFFCYLNLFVFSMLVLILGDNLPVLFVGWEGVGLCSYLLIGFWYGKMPNAQAGKKAFLANRIGDFGLIVAMFLLVVYCGSLDWDGIQKHAHDLLKGPGPINLWPIGGGKFEDYSIASLKIPLHKLQPDKPWQISAATAVGLALFLGATGKSAQIPLYVWLPDAMAGPTPVSALIHAATMVTAGVYLLCRLSFVFVLSPAAMFTVAMTGAATAFLAATIALVQNDIKKVLAYSTVSQLGFMVLGCGVGAFTAGFFHVFTHAFFKACLFLGAGSVIHAMHARIHDEDRSQDMRNMGGLRKYMPLTYWTFVASTLCIIGLPGTSGFFSKDEILARALIQTPEGPKVLDGPALWAWPTWAPWVIWGLGISAATMTAFYMSRCVFMTFWGEFRGWTVGRPSQLPKSKRASQLDDHDDDHDDHDDDDDDHHHEHEDLSQPSFPPRESPRPMTIPLLILAAAAIVAGIFNPAAIKLFSDHFDFMPLDHWMEPLMAEAGRGIHPVEHHLAHSRELISTFGAFTAFAIGSGLAYWVYVKEKGKPARDLMLKVPRLYRLVLDKWRVDEAYDKTVVAGVDALADTAASVDQGIVDFFIARFTSLVVAASGTILRVVQNGVVHVYAAVMVVGVVGLGWFFLEPHADFTVAERDGDYVLVAGPGPSYSFRWYPDATKDPQAKDFNTTDQMKIKVGDGKSQTVKLEVRNAFGRIASKVQTITRPSAPTAPGGLPPGGGGGPPGGGGGALPGGGH